MNKTSLKNRLEDLNKRYPKEKCFLNRVQTDDGREHANELYELTCLAAEMYHRGVTSKSTVRKWGELIGKYEYYKDESGRGHFTHIFGPVK